MVRSCFVALVAAVAAKGAVAATSTASPTAPSGAAPPPGPGYIELADDEPVPGNYIHPSTPNLVDDVATSGTNGATGAWRYYTILVPAGAASLDVDRRTSDDLDVRLPVAGLGRQRGLHRRHPGRRLVVRRRVHVRGGVTQITFTVTARH